MEMRNFILVAQWKVANCRFSWKRGRKGSW